MAGTLHCTVMTPEGKVFEGDVDMVVATGADGQIGILPKHAPLITALGAGVLRAKSGSGEEHWLVIGGFLEVLGEDVIVLAHKLERLEDIDLAQAEKDAAGGGDKELVAAARARVNYAKNFK